MESEEKEISAETEHPLKGKHLLEQVEWFVFIACSTILKSLYFFYQFIHVLSFILLEFLSLNLLHRVVL